MNFGNIISNIFDSEEVSKYVKNIFENILNIKFNSIYNLKDFICKIYPEYKKDKNLLFALHFILLQNIQYRLPKIDDNYKITEISNKDLYLYYYNNYFPKLNKLDPIEFEIIKRELVDEIDKPIGWRARSRIISNEIRKIKGFYCGYDLIWDMEYKCAISWAFLKRNEPGKFIFGDARNCCNICRQVLNNKIFRIGAHPDIMKKNNMFEKLNICEENYYENYIWFEKEIYEDIYSVEENISLKVSRKIYPNIPLHPLCNCSFNCINPEGGYLNQESELCLRKDENEKEWEKWYKENILEKFPEYKFKIEFDDLNKKAYKIYDIIISKENEKYKTSFKYKRNEEVFKKINELKPLLMKNIF
jgi:hypothetical protein